MAEIYINPYAGLRTEEWRFVLAHEFLHAALQHAERLNGRHPLLWNIACDFVINDWLLEMHIGCMPNGALYDAQFHGLSAENVYDRLLPELRRYEKLRSCDLIYGQDGTAQNAEQMDDFYRRALQRGLQYHESSSRGFLPAGLIEEIHALSVPPIAWNVRLGTWFVQHFPTEQLHRSYSRMSRRQSTAPDIPRPAWLHLLEPQEEKTFGVVLDTSGSLPQPWARFPATVRRGMFTLFGWYSAMQQPTIRASCVRTALQKLSMCRDGEVHSCSRESTCWSAQKIFQRMLRFY